MAVLAMTAATTADVKGGAAPHWHVQHGRLFRPPTRGASTAARPRADLWGGGGGGSDVGGPGRWRLADGRGRWRSRRRGHAWPHGRGYCRGRRQRRCCCQKWRVTDGSDADVGIAALVCSGRAREIPRAPCPPSRGVCSSVLIFVFETQNARDVHTVQQQPSRARPSSPRPSSPPQPSCRPLMPQRRRGLQTWSSRASG